MVVKTQEMFPNHAQKNWFLNLFVHLCIINHHSLEKVRCWLIQKFLGSGDTIVASADASLSVEKVGENEYNFYYQTACQKFYVIYFTAPTGLMIQSTIQN